MKSVILCVMQNNLYIGSLKLVLMMDVGIVLGIVETVYANYLDIRLCIRLDLHATDLLQNVVRLKEKTNACPPKQGNTTKNTLGGHLPK